MCAYRRGVRVFDAGGVVEDFGHRLPVTIIESRLGPAGHFKASIVTFAFAQVRADDGTKCGLPSAVPRVGINGVGAAVRIFDFKLGEYADTVTIVIRIATVEAEPTSIPAVTEPETHGICACREVFGHVVGPHFDALLIIGPAGNQCVIADFSTIDFRFDQAERGQIEPRTHGLVFEFDFGSHERQMTMVAFRLSPGGAYEVGNVVEFFKKAGFKMQGAADCAQRPVTGGDSLHGGKHFFAGDERLELPRHKHAVVGGQIGFFFARFTARHAAGEGEQNLCIFRHCVRIGPVHARCADCDAERITRIVFNSEAGDIEVAGQGTGHNLRHGCSSH